MIIKFVKIECERNTSQGDGLLSMKYVGEGSVQLTLSHEFLTSRVSWGSWKLFLIYENLFFYVDGCFVGMSITSASGIHRD